MKIIMDYCDVCGHEHTGSECLICTLRCPYCNDILGEDTIDSYIVGKCRHLICYEDLNNGKIFWINNEYEDRFQIYCEKVNDESQFNSSQEQLFFSSISEKVLYKQFAEQERLIRIEHKLFANDGRPVPIYFYIIGEAKNHCDN